MLGYLDGPLGRFWTGLRHRRTMRIDWQRQRRRNRIVDVVFLYGVVTKGIDGFAETVVGIPLLFLAPTQVQRIVGTLTDGTLDAHPHNWLASWLMRMASDLTSSGILIGAAYLLFHGVLKLAIVVALATNKRRVYPWAIAALGAFLVVQVIQLALAPSIGLVLMSILDALIIAITWREWRHGRSLRTAWKSVSLDMLRLVRRWRGARPGRPASVTQDAL